MINVTCVQRRKKKSISEFQQVGMGSRVATELYVEVGYGGCMCAYILRSDTCAHTKMTGGEKENKRDHGAPFSALRCSRTRWITNETITGLGDCVVDI